MRVTEKKRRWIKKMIEDLRYGLYITEWRIEILYAEEDEINERFDTNIAAKIYTQLSYMNASITLYPEFWEHEEDRQREILIHELCHIHTQPMRDMWHRMASGKLVTVEEMNDINERMTSMFERLATDSLKDRLKKIEI